MDADGKQGFPEDCPGYNCPEVDCPARVCRANGPVPPWLWAKFGKDRHFYLHWLEPITGLGFVALAGARQATLLYTAATAYRNYKDVSGDPGKKTGKVLKTASTSGYSGLRQRHVKDHRALFDRVRLNLANKSDKPMATAQRIAAVRSGRPDPFLAAQAFQFGRYLLMASSRSTPSLFMRRST